MDNDVFIRLKVRGENLTAETRAALGGMEAEIEKRGIAAGGRLGDGIRTGLVASTAAITAVAAGVATAVNQSFALATDLSASSRQLGIGVEALQEYRGAARATGVEISALDSNIGELTKRVGEAISGNRDAQAAFTDLGVSFETAQGRGRATEAVLRDVITRLHDIDDPAQRAALGTALLGDEYQKIESLVRAGASGIDAMTAALDQQNGRLTAEQVEILRQANAEYDRLQTILSVNIASVVAANADAIIQLTSSIASLVSGAFQWLAVADRFYASLEGSGEIYAPGLARLRNNDLRGRGLPTEDENYVRTDGRNSIISNLGVPRGFSGRQFNAILTGAVAPIAIPSTSPIVAAPSRSRGGGGGGRGGNGDAARAEREAERAAERRAQILERQEESIARQLTALDDAQRIESIRAEQGEGAADIDRARADFLRSHAEAAAQTVEELARMLDIAGPLSASERDRLQTMIDQLDVAERQTVEQAKQLLAADRARDAERALLETKEAQARAAEESLREQQRIAEAQIEDLAGLYADLFTGSTGNIWSNFKRLGISAISEIAARWTLARLSGQSFNLASTIGGLTSQGGILGGFGSIIGSAGGLFGGAGAGAGGVISATQGAAGAAGTAGGAGGFLGAAAPWALGALAAVQILPSLLGGLKTKKGSATLAVDAGLLSVGSVTGNSGSRKAAASGALGSVIDALNGIADQLGGTVGGSPSVSIGVRKKSYRVDTTGQGRTKKGAGVIDFGTDQEAAIRYAIGEALRDGVIGGISDASKRILASGQDLEKAIEKAISIEQLPKLLKARLDPLGAAIDDIDAKYAKLAATLKEGGASAEQIANARQLWQLERDDAIKNIGAASATLRDYLKSLTVGSDSPLSPKRQREAAAAAFAAYEGQLAGLTAGQAQVDALRASGASPEAIAAAEAEQRRRAAAFDQQKFAEAADLWLSTARRTDASTDGFFDIYERVKQLTERAASMIEAAVPAASANDPFAELTATAAQNTVAILDTQTGILNAINDNLAIIAGNVGGGGIGGGFVTQPRNYA